MRNKISELMDGELDTANADEVISALKEKDDLLNDWETYHMISEALRQPAASLLPINVAGRVSDRLVSEPILLLISPPAGLQLRKRKLMVLSAAASFAILVSGWLVMQTTNMQQETPLAENVNNKAVVQVDHPVAFQPSSVFTLPFIPQQHPGDYPLIHRGFSSHTMIHAPVMSVYQIEDRQEKAR